MKNFVVLHFTNAFKILGMLSPCFSLMSSQQFNELPNSKNAVESYNRFGRSVHRQPLKVAMMATYREDMAKSFEIMARGRGFLTSYEGQTPTGRDKCSKQQNSARYGVPFVSKLLIKKDFMNLSTISFFSKNL